MCFSNSFYHKKGRWCQHSRFTDVFVNLSFANVKGLLYYIFYVRLHILLADAFANIRLYRPIEKPVVCISIHPKYSILLRFWIENKVISHHEIFRKMARNSDAQRMQTILRLHPVWKVEIKRKKVRRILNLLLDSFVLWIRNWIQRI